MKVEIWSDVVCPWCYIGKRRFEAALAGFAHADEVEVVWRSFELDPSAPRRRAEPTLEHLAAKYGMTTEQALASQRQLTGLAAAEGLEYHLDRTVSGNTFDAHRLLHLAAAGGRQGELKEALLRAYFTEGVALGEPAALLEVAASAGVDPAAARRVLDGDEYADAVRADEDDARALGITGVPFFVIDRAYGVSGAQPSDLLRGALERAWQEGPRLPERVPAADGTDDGSCAGDSCAL